MCKLLECPDQIISATLMLQLKETESTPWHLTKTGGLAAAPDFLLPSNIQPSFSMVAPNQQFGFKLPIVGEVNSNVNHGSWHNSSCTSSIFSADASWASTTPTSHTASVCSSSQGNQENHQAPHLTQQPLHLSPWEDHRQSTMLEVPSLWLEEPVNLPSLHCEDLNNPDFPPSCPAGLWHTASFYDTPFNGVRLHRHTLFVTPTEDKDHDPAGEGNYSDTPIDKTTPSEDNHFAESVLQGGKAKLTPFPILNTQAKGNIPQIPMEQQASTLSQFPQTQSMTHPLSTTSQLLEAVNPPILPIGPAIQGAKPWQIQFYKPVVQDILEPLNMWRKQSAKDDCKACQSQMAGGLTMQMIFLWESLGNWHLALRKKAHVYVSQHYKWDPKNCHEVNSGIMKDLLVDCGVFLRDGIDENISNSSSLSKLFPEIFSAKLKVILNKMVSLQSKVDFRVDQVPLNEVDYPWKLLDFAHA
ncbi:hypothetical protein EDC04DRAFT_2610404 [Pisolithus marmoratus]|nr:hypothetical protein EDC04DRAFT_2610404 [Pisolithus marmoratus]